MVGALQPHGAKRCLEPTVATRMETVKKFREAALRTMRSAVSQNKRRLIDNHQGWDLDLSYITERIIAMGFPAVGMEAMYRNPRLGKKGVVSYLDQTHGTHYRVFNVCAEEKYQYSEDVFHGRVSVYPFYDHNPAPLFLVAGFCLEASQWLSSHPENVIVIHCKAGKGRTGFITACLLLHLGTAIGASAAIAIFTDKRVEVGRALNQPSQIKYVKYWDDICKRNAILAAEANNAHEAEEARHGSSMLLPDPKRSELFLQCLFLSNANPDWTKLRIVFYQNGVFLAQRALKAKSGGTFLLFCNFELTGDIKVAIFSSPGEEEAAKALVMAAQEEQDKVFDKELGEGLTAAATRTKEDFMRKMQNKVRSKLLVRYWFNTDFVEGCVLEARKPELDVANVADPATGLFNDRTVLRFGFTYSSTATFSPDSFLAVSGSSSGKKERQAPTPIITSAVGVRRGSFSRTTPPPPPGSLSSSLGALSLSTPTSGSPAHIPNGPSLATPRSGATPPPPPPPACSILLPPSPPADSTPPGSPSSLVVGVLPEPDRLVRERSASTSTKRVPPKPPAFKLTEEEAQKLPNWSASLTSPSGGTTDNVPPGSEWERGRSRSRTASCSMKRLDSIARERPPLPTFRTMPSHLPSHKTNAPHVAQQSVNFLTPKALSSPRRTQSMPGETQEPPSDGVWFPFPTDSSPSPKSSTVRESFVSAFEMTEERSRSPSTSQYCSLTGSAESKASSAVSAQGDEEYPDFSRIESEVTPVTGTSDLQEEDEGFDSGEDQEDGAEMAPLDISIRSPPSPKVGERANTEPRNRSSPPPTIYETETDMPTDPVRRGSLGEGRSRLRERRRGVTVSSSRASLETSRIPLAHLVRVEKSSLDKQIAQYKRSLVTDRGVDVAISASSRSLLS